MFVGILGRACHPFAAQNAFLVPIRRIELIEQRVSDAGAQLEIRVRMGNGPRWIFVTDAGEQARLMQYFSAFGDRPVFFPVPTWGSKPTHRKRK